MPLSVAIFTSLELLLVAWFDYKTKKIKNYWPLINIAFFVLFVFLFPDFFRPLLNHLWIPLIVLVVSFALYGLKIMGAGDGKFLFSLMLIIPSVDQLQYLIFLAYATVFVTPFYLLLRKVRSGSWFKGKNIFAPIILLAWVGFLCVNFLKK